MGCFITGGGEWASSEPPEPPLDPPLENYTFVEEGSSWHNIKKTCPYPSRYPAKAKIVSTATPDIYVAIENVTTIDERR